MGEFTLGGLGNYGINNSWPKLNPNKAKQMVQPQSSTELPHVSNAEKMDTSETVSLNEVYSGVLDLKLKKPEVMTAVEEFAGIKNLKGLEQAEAIISKVKLSGTNLPKLLENLRKDYANGAVVNAEHQVTKTETEHVALHVLNADPLENLADLPSLN